MSCDAYSYRWRYFAAPALVAWVVVAVYCSPLNAGEFSSIRFLWAGQPPAVSISLHYSGKPDLPMANLSPWRMTQAFQSAAGHHWAVAIGDQPPLGLPLDPPDGSSSPGDILALVWLANDAVQATLITLPTGAAAGRVCILNLTGQPLITRAGDWNGSVPKLAAHCLPLAAAGRSEVVLAFAISHNGQPRPVFSASLTVHPGDRVLIVAGPADPHPPVSRRLPVRRICLRTSL